MDFVWMDRLGKEDKEGKGRGPATRALFPTWTSGGISFLVGWSEPVWVGICCLVMETVRGGEASRGAGGLRTTLQPQTQAGKPSRAPEAMMVAWGLSQSSCSTGLDPGVCVKSTSDARTHSSAVAHT